MLMEKVDALQASVNSIAEIVLKIQKEKIAVTGLSRSKLLELRKTGKVSSSSISGKKPYYKLSDFKKLLDKNEEEH
jgi:hypothetical protein